MFYSRFIPDLLWFILNLFIAYLIYPLIEGFFSSPRPLQNNNLATFHGEINRAENGAIVVPFRSRVRHSLHSKFKIIRMNFFHCAL